MPIHLTQSKGLTQLANIHSHLTRAVLALSILLAALSTSIANIALPELASAFDAPIPQVQWVVTAYLVALTVSTLAAGWLGDRYGLRRMLLIGLTLFAVSVLACGAALNLATLITARVFQGVSAALLMVTTLALMRENAGTIGLGKAMGLLGTTSALGTALGPSLGGVIIANATWRAIFLVQAPLGLLALVLAINTLPRGGASSQNQRLSLQILRDSALPRHLIVNALVASVMMATLIVGPFYLSLARFLGPAETGLVMSIGPMISIVSGIPSGRATDRFGARLVLRLGLILLFAGAVALTVLPWLLGTLGYVAAVVLLTPGYQLFQAANNTQVLAEVPPERRGAVSGLLSLSRNLGLVAGASLLGAVFAFGTGDFASASPEEVTRGVQLTFTLASLMMAFALWIVWQKPRAETVKI